MGTRVVACSGHPTAAFAAAELSRYIALMDDNPSAGQAGEIRVGLFSDVLPGRAGPADPFDDEIFVDVRGGSGTVAGANPRSCLIAAYRLLREAGCRFLRPGPDGEYVPKVSWPAVNVRVDERPSYRHRGVCIEGAVSREIFLDIVDWLPKNGMNAYFIQFREGFTFFDRWYSHRNNPTLPPETKTVEEIRAIVQEGAEAIALRGLIHHAVGHGWTCEPLGIPGLGWEETPDVPPGASRFFAELGGERRLFGGVPLNTNLCYGNPEARALVVEDIVSYLRAHRGVDALHFWLADGANNNCECPLCRDTRPADFYVDMLNALDERLTTLGIGTRVVFLIYVDLLWRPEKTALKNPGRFILMFAPITRTYSKAFVAGGALPEPPPYVRNRLEFPASVEGNLAHLKTWQSVFGGDGFDFDYHLMWDHYRDPGYEDLSRVLHEDIQNLAAVGLNGLISCQVQRVFFPSPLPMAVLAHTLWNREADFDALAGDVYASAYGPDGGAVRQYLRNLTALFRPQWLRREEPTVSTEQARRLRGVAPLVAEFRAVIGAHAGEHDRCRKESWRLLALHGDYCALLAAFCLRLAEGDPAGAREELERLKGWVYSHEPEIVRTFDCEIFNGTVGSMVQLP